IYLLTKWHISKATAHLFISPVIALYVGFVFLGETLNKQVYIGTAFVIAGVIFINLKKQVEKNTNNSTLTSSKNISAK
ncbi:DMT family transporter, partial [Priestia megaterium]|uniref:DMT family transporter n=1 Tax=Priestia megaterium TaxID=1404 RepID=UPI0030094BDA